MRSSSCLLLFLTLNLHRAAVEFILEFVLLSAGQTVNLWIEGTQPAALTFSFWLACLTSLETEQQDVAGG